MQNKLHTRANDRVARIVSHLNSEIFASDIHTELEIQSEGIQQHLIDLKTPRPRPVTCAK